MTSQQPQPRRTPGVVAGGRHNGNAPKTHEQQQLVLASKKIKRLNGKLARTRDIAVAMVTKSHRSNEISAREVERWAKDILKLIES